jgi:hypothetical protein
MPAIGGCRWSSFQRASTRREILAGLKLVEDSVMRGAEAVGTARHTKSASFRRWKVAALSAGPQRAEHVRNHRG